MTLKENLLKSLDRPWVLKGENPSNFSFKAKYNVFIYFSLVFLYAIYSYKDYKCQGK